MLIVLCRFLWSLSSLSLQLVITTLRFCVFTTPTPQLFMGAEGGGCHEGMWKWERDEIILMLTLRAEIGNKWERIGAQLRRSPSSVRNKYTRMKRACGNPGRGYMCHKCGMRKKGHICGLATAPELEDEFETSLFWFADTLALSPHSREDMQDAEDDERAAENPLSSFTSMTRWYFPHEPLHHGYSFEL